MLVAGFTSISCSTNKKLKNCLTVEIFLDLVDCSNDCFLNNSIQDIIS